MRTQLIVLCSLFVTMMVAIGGVGVSATRQESDAMLALYQDRIVPLRQLKTVSDLYAVNIVDAAHKAAAGTMGVQEALNAVAQAKTGIEAEWKAYTATELVPEEVALIQRMASLRQGADSAVARLETLLRAEDTAALQRFTAQDMYPALDPLQELWRG